MLTEQQEKKYVDAWYVIIPIQIFSTKISPVDLDIYIVEERERENTT